MKTKKCIVLITYVPDEVRKATDDGIAPGMYLNKEAVDKLLRGEMFAPIDCFWSRATPLSETRAILATQALEYLGFYSDCIYLI